MLDRVVDQVDQHLLEQHRIDRHDEVGRHVEIDLPGAERALHPRERGADELLDGDQLAVRDEAALDARELEQVAEHALEPAGVVDDLARQIVTRGGRRGDRRRRAAWWPRR